jgi:hypothetical protein
MSVATLSKFTVPLASDQSASNQGLLMPKLQYRFRLILENFGVSTPRTEITKQVIDVTRPSLTFDETILRVYLAGKHTWDPITINLRDDVNNSVTRLCGEQIQKQFDFFEQSSASSGTDYKFTGRIEMLDGGNGANAVTVLETWELYGAYVQNINYNTMAYATSDPAQITLTVRYDNAIQAPRGTGVGTAVARTLGTLVTGGGSTQAV